MLFSLGSNGSGQLGLDHAEDVDHPTATLLPLVLEDDDYPATITAGGNHTIIQMTSGIVFATGDNTHGQCGLSKVSKPYAQEIPNLKIKLCAATWEATCFVDQADRILVCGNGQKG